MKKYAYYLLLLVVPGLLTGSCQNGASTSEPEKPATENVEKILKDLEIEWSQVAVSQDITVLEKILSPDLVYHSEEGQVLGRDSYIEKYINKQKSIQSVSVEDMKVFLYGDGFAVVTGSSTETGMDEEGSEYSFRGIWTNIWMKKEGGWQCIAGHGNILPQ